MINNNVWAEVVTSDIPAANGHVHVISRLLLLPCDVMEDLLTSRPELRPFHKLMRGHPEYDDAVTSRDQNVTLFVPSARFLRTVTSDQMLRMRADPAVLTRVGVTS